MVTAVKQYEGIGLPGAGRWNVDPAHSDISFTVRHLMVSKVRGKFSGFGAELNIGEGPEDSSVVVTIDPATIDTGIGQRDDHLRSPDFFDAAAYADMTFRSTRVEPTRGGKFRLHGDLTIKGITRPVVLDAEFDGVVADPWGKTRAGFSASGEIDREDWGMTWNQAIEAGGFVVGKKIKIEIQIEAVRADAAAA